MRQAFVLCMVLMSGGAAMAQPADAPPGLAFHASFDGALDADFARGDASGTTEGAPEFAEGRFGQGLVVGDLDGSAGVRYATEGNFSFERGTISLWVQPVNWRGDERGNRLFFNAWPEGGGLFSLYKYTSTAWGLTLFVDPDLGRRARTFAYSPIDDWVPGEWYHVACTWGRHEGISLYVNGEEVKTLNGSGLVETPPQETMRFGGDWHSEGGRTVIDEAMIFDRRLARHEIAALAGLEAQTPPADQPRDLPGVMLTHAYLSGQVVARVHADAVGEPPAQTARLMLTPAGDDRTVFRETGADLRPAGVNQLTLDLAGVAHGNYVARLELLADGRVIGVEEHALSHETDFTWEQAAQLGREDRVLRDFSPLRVEGNTVTCTMASYEPGPFGLPRRIIAAGEELLVDTRYGVQLHVDTGPRGPIGPAAPAITESSPTTVTLQAEHSGGGLTYASEVAIRYDGTVWTRLEVTPDGEREINALSIAIPLRPEVAKYFSYWAPGETGEERYGYGALPESDGTMPDGTAAPEGYGVAWSRPFLPSLWIGDEERGLSWYAESDEGWDLADEGMLTITRGSAATALSMNVIREPRVLTEPLVIEFGLQATPVRELADDWRAYQWVPSSDISRFFLGLRDRPFEERGLGDERPRGRIAYLYTHHRHFTNTLARDPEEFREMIARAKGYGLFTVPYTEARFLPENHGDLLLLRDEMPMQPPVRACGYGLYTARGCCLGGPFSDWLVWYVRHMIDEYGTNGVYFDELQPLACSNAAHGCGYVDAEGARRPTYPMRAFLDTFRRVREVFEETGEDYWISYHISMGRNGPMPTYGDDLLMAEELYYAVRDNPDYTEITSGGQWLASFASAAWGIPSVMLPQFKMSGEWMRDPELAQRLMAAIVPHDLMVWPIFAHSDTIMALRDRLIEFGIGEADTRFHGYWEADAPVRCAEEQVKAGAYVRPGRAMLCLGNWSDETISCEVEVDLAALGLTSVTRARDAMTGESLEFDGEKVFVDLAAKRLTLVEMD